MRKSNKYADINYLIIKKDNIYRVEEREIFDIKNIDGTYLSSTTHKEDAYNSVKVLNFILSQNTNI